MSTSPDDIARSAAARLGPRLGAGLPMEVEKVIAAGGELEPRRYVGVAEVVAIAGFLLACAQLAWQIYKDTRNKDAIKRELRLKVTRPAAVSITVADTVIEAVVAELPEA
jgi:hypothetical protein